MRAGQSVAIGEDGHVARVEIDLQLVDRDFALVHEDARVAHGLVADDATVELVALPGDHEPQVVALQALEGFQHVVVTLVAADVAE